MENVLTTLSQVKKQTKQLKTKTQVQQQLDLTPQQLKHLIDIIRLRYISPYKIMYMINQQQADMFKLRNQSTGCCSSSSITIPKHQMSKTQLFLSEAINQCLKINKINELFEDFEKKYENIVKSGRKENLKVDQNTKKFLVEKIMSEGINLYIFNQVIQRLKKQSDSIANSAMLWATPNTWYAKYPHTPLNFISSESISRLMDQNVGFFLQKQFLKDYKDNLLKELRLLQRDGRFEELLWARNYQQSRNDKKVMNFPENYAIDGTEETFKKGYLTYPNLKKSLLTLRSLPFELNSKCNLYCTVSENNQISYFKQTVHYIAESDKKSRFTTFCPIGEGLNCEIQFVNVNKQTKNQQILIKQGDLFVVDNQLVRKVSLRGKCEHFFLFKSWIFTLQKH